MSETEVVSPLAMQEDDILLPGSSKWDSKAYRKKCFWTLMILMAFIMLPITMFSPSSIEMQYTIVCRYLEVDSEHCTSSNEVNQYIAGLNNVSGIIKTIPTLVMIPIITAFVEKIGYAKGLLLISSGTGIQLSLFYVMTEWVPGSWSPYRLVFLDLCDAASGGMFTFTNVLILCVSQLFSNPKERPIYISRMQGVLSIAGVVGPLLGGVLSSLLGIGKFVILINIVFIAAMISVVLFVDLPDVSMNVAASEDSSEAANKLAKPGLSSFLKEQFTALKVFKFAHVDSRSLRITAIMFTIWVVIFQKMDVSSFTIVLLYGKQFFSWTQKSTGAIIALASGSQVFWSFFGFPMLQSYLLKYMEADSHSIDSIDRIIVAVSIACHTTGLTLMALSSTSLQFFGSFSILTNMTMSSSVTKPALMKLFPVEEASSLITALSEIEVLSSSLLPIVLLWGYKSTLAWWPTCEFTIEASISVVFLISSYFFIIRRG